MFGRHVPLADQVVEFFNGALAIPMHLPTSFTHIETLVRRVSLATALLARQSLPSSTIVVSLRSAMSAGFLKRDAVRTIFLTILVGCSTLIS